MEGLYVGLFKLISFCGNMSKMLRPSVTAVETWAILSLNINSDGCLLSE